MSRFMKTVAVGGCAVVLMVGGTAVAQKAHVMTKLTDAQWGPAPPLVPAGAQIAVLSGDPMKATAEIGRMGIEFKINAALNQYKTLKNPPPQRGGRPPGQ